MTRIPALLVLALLASACGSGPKVVIRAELSEGGEPIADLPVRLVPYDRQALMDSLAKEVDTPEPTVPQELVLALRNLEAEERTVRSRGDTAVARWTAQRRAFTAQADSIRKARQAWTDTAFRGYDDAVKERVTAAGLSEQVDTTDTSGRAALSAEAGQWWISARYVLPDAELEWNLPVTVSGDSVVVRLTRKNARERPYL